jgi:hypothetical protein
MHAAWHTRHPMPARATLDRRVRVTGSATVAGWVGAGSVQVELSSEPTRRWRPRMELTPAEPSAADVAGLRALVDEVMRRVS